MCAMIKVNIQQQLSASGEKRITSRHVYVCINNFNNALHFERIARKVYIVFILHIGELSTYQIFIYIIAA